MKIGLLSDTHGFLDKRIMEYFTDCDEIWHAGDIGSAEVADALQQFKPLRAVYGNIDDGAMQQRFPEDSFFACDGKNIFMTHIAGSPPNYNPRLKKILKEKKPDILVCGHSHILKVMHDKALNVLYLNPGAAGNQGFHRMKTILRFEIDGGKIFNMEVIELGKRGAL